MGNLKRWLPFVGSIVVVGTEILRGIGKPGLADAIAGVLQVVYPEATGDQALFGAAVASATGLGLQLYSRYQKAKSQ